MVRIRSLCRSKVHVAVYHAIVTAAVVSRAMLYSYGHIAMRRQHRAFGSASWWGLIWYVVLVFSGMYVCAGSAPKVSPLPICLHTVKFCGHSASKKGTLRL